LKFDPVLEVDGIGYGLRVNECSRNQREASRENRLCSVDSCLRRVVACSCAAAPAEAAVFQAAAAVAAARKGGVAAGAVDHDDARGSYVKLYGKLLVRMLVVLTLATERAAESVV